MYIKRLLRNHQRCSCTARFRYSLDESFDIGRDSASPVSEEYKAGARFTGGNIERVIIDLAGERHTSGTQ